MKKPHLELTTSEREQLKSLLKKGSLNVRVQKRIMGLLELDKGKSYKSVSELLSLSNITVQGWGKKYKTEGLDFIRDKPRSGRPVGLTAEQRAKITALACSEPPEGYARWSLRLLADKVVELNYTDTVSHTEIGRVLKKMNCVLTLKNNGASER
ncbi:MAG: helix-turn-helix domain-containing protein [Deltaproteobacteria bacterium]|nr:helix-turn-helix domain-containing protein [Deltaproteobacteria bacterium]